MSKRSKKDSKTRAAKISKAVEADPLTLPVELPVPASFSEAAGQVHKTLQESLPSLAIELNPPSGKPAARSLDKPASRTAKQGARVSSAKKAGSHIQSQNFQDEDPELEELLRQVDKMLTEMNQSKWMSSNWPYTSQDH